MIVRVFGRKARVANIVSPEATPDGLFSTILVAVPLRLVWEAASKVIREDGIAVTVKFWEVEVPAPGVETVTGKVPTEAISAALMLEVT